jgi:DNA-binding winged helix-turn-helix (wHTH) protein
MSDKDISFGPFRLIPSRRLLLEGDRPLHIGSRALAMRQVLLERAGEVVEKTELARLIWPSAGGATRARGWRATAIRFQQLR